MSNFLIFLIFYTMMLTVFGGMQYMVYRAYTRWYTYSFSRAETHRFCRNLATGVLIAGNIVFFIRFPLSYTSLHESLLIQYIFIIPGGIYFAIVFLLILCSTVYYSYKGLLYLRRNYFGSPKAKIQAAGDPSAEKPAASGSNISRKQFLRTAGTAAFTAPLILTTGLSAATHRNYIITKKTLLYPELPSGLEGLKLVHISDIHSGIYMNRNQISEIYEIINSLNPNLVAITGDLVDTHVSEIPAVRDTIGELKSDYGVFACPGNHDHYASVDALLSALDDKPVKMLQNDAATITINGEQVSILGIDDAGEAGRDFSDFGKAVSAASPDSFRILLTHRPHMFDKGVDQNVHLTLAGHTHGGQIGFNLAGAELYPIDLFHRYSRGHYRYNDMYQLYVNVGVGLVGAPIRLVRPEITELTFTSDPSKVRHQIVNA